MKKMRRLLAVLLAAVMVLAMGTTALAADDEDANDSVTYSYEIYQIFTGTYTGGELTDVKWGKNAEIPTTAGDTQAKVGDAVSDDVLRELTAAAALTSDSEKLAVILKYAKLIDEDDDSYVAYATADGTGNTLVIDHLPDGYYLVKDAAGSELDGNDAYTTYVALVVNGTMSITRKADVPTVEKKIVETVTTGEGENTKTEEKKSDANEASIGDTVHYEITGTLPSNLADYKEYYYVFTDTLSKGLTYKNDVKVVVVNGTTETDVTDYFYKGTETDTITGGTIITVGIQDLKALTCTPDSSEAGNTTVLPVTLTRDSRLVITYSATLNKDAVIAGDGNTNDVALAYSNNPNESGEGSTTPPPENPENEPKKPEAYGETPKSTVTTYTTELTILKTDGEGHVLTGAAFTLTGNGVNIVLVTKETFRESDEGEYYKLADGTYTLTAPTDLYDNLTTKYRYDEETGEYSAVTDGAEGEYWKLKTAEGEEATYTMTAPEDMYEDLSQKYAKIEVITSTGIGQGENGADVAVVGTIDEGGHVTFTGLGAGTYTITETVTPAGYNTIDPIEFTVSWTEEDGFASNKEAVKVETDNTLFTTIVNKKGSFLPSTGGVGTSAFYILGAVLAVGAAVLLVVRRCMRAEK